MITIVSQANGDTISIFPDGKHRSRKECYGKCTDAKPTEGMKNADIFYEMDTKRAYLFDEDTQTWLEQ